MERKSFLKGVSATVLSGAVLAACGSPAAQSSEGSVAWGEGTIVHSVYFWLRTDLTDQEKEEFPQFFEALKKVPGFTACRVATPAPTTPREVVDNSFSYHWIAVFPSMDEVNIYEKHPDHLAAAEKFSKYWTRVEVRDSIA
ncbi:Dabb family protein [Sphingobacterium chungjuense]|uniref:Dabb family protein n=1 Tax=Sphingobacterium chungjuense TaxID=2675553 RepID=UPI0014073F70|nr:Dabb family protein [Sphingobacterium chungjuense]